MRARKFVKKWAEARGLDEDFEVVVHCLRHAGAVHSVDVHGMRSTAVRGTWCESSRILTTRYARPNDVVLGPHLPPEKPAKVDAGLSAAKGATAQRTEGMERVLRDRRATFTEQDAKHPPIWELARDAQANTVNTRLPEGYNRRLAVIIEKQRG